MCGIFGILSRQRNNNLLFLKRALELIEHRGPDDMGEWWSDDGRVGLGHRRLAIIDLSASGHQPMQNSDGNLNIVFNGEIYNFLDLRCELIKKGHKFQTSSDTEVILVAYSEWGQDCLSHLDGMFAFALYDSKIQQLFVARDRAGEKPFYYSITNDGLIFASELKALIADERCSYRVASEALDCYLSMGFIPGDLCILEGVKKLPPAHAMTYNLNTGNSYVWKYWNLSEFEFNESNKIDESSLLEQLEFLLEDSVRRQMIADVPVGVLLSGGVDSSLITAMAARSQSRVKTYTISFPGHETYDESSHARLIADYFSTEHTELVAEESTLDLLPMLARQFDEPIVDSSMIPTYMVSRLIRQHCTVALGGDGGDELFGGYGHYSCLLWLKKRITPLSRFLIRLPVSKMAEYLLPVGFKGKNWLEGLGVDFKNDLPQIASYFNTTERNKMMRKDYRLPLMAERLRRSRIPKTSDFLKRATRMDFENYLPEDILVKVDRASMLNSLEIRAPFLDYRIIEFAFNKIPSHLKTTENQKKIILKKLCMKLLPPEFDKQRKQGFSIPLGKWLETEPWKKMTKDILLGSSDSSFNRKYIENLLTGQASGRSNSERIFALVMFELWRNEYRIKL